LVILNMLQVWFFSRQTEVNTRKPMPATSHSLVKQIIPDTSAPSRERQTLNLSD
jgi:hypothetical protein